MTWLGFVLVRRMYITKKAKRAKDLTMTFVPFRGFKGLVYSPAKPRTVRMRILQK